MFLTSRFPYPLDKGDKLRVYFQLKYLSQNNEIHLIAINTDKVHKAHITELETFCATVTIYKLPIYKRIFQLMLSPFYRLPLQVAYFYNPRIKKQIKQRVDLIKPSHLHCHLIRTVEYAKDIDGVKKSLDFMDAFAIGMEKRQSIERNLLKRFLFSYEKKQLYKYETKALNLFDTFSIITNQDKTWINNPNATEIQVIPNGVDFQSFFPRNEIKIYDLVFMGNLDYPPNIVAVGVLINDILPLLINEIPSIKLLIAGNGASKELKNLSSAHVDVRSDFKHISDSLAISKIMIAPTQIHIGLPNKVLQAMAMKLPCIVSELTNNSIQARPKESIIVANTATEFSAAVKDLLTNEQKAITIGEAGYEFVKAHYTWERQNELFNKKLIGQ